MHQVYLNKHTCYLHEAYIDKHTCYLHQVPKQADMLFAPSIPKQAHVLFVPSISKFDGIHCASFGDINHALNTLISCTALHYKSIMHSNQLPYFKLISQSTVSHSLSQIQILTIDYLLNHLWSITLNSYIDDQSFDKVYGSESSILTFT